MQLVMNKLSILNIFFILIFLLVQIKIVNAGVIIGKVINAQNGKAISDVLITIEELNLETKTDLEGHYSFDSLTSKSYNLKFSHKDYETLVATDIYVLGDAVKRCDVELTPKIKSIDKMTVRATSFRKPIDMTSSTKIISYDELLRAPGALVDVQRVVTMLPSVSSSSDNTNEIIVRGGAPGENLFLLDNIEIPNPNHFAQQGSGGGVISLINPFLVKSITFNAGAPPSQYGGKASSVLDVRLRDGNTSMVIGGIDLGIAGVGLHLEGPIISKNANFMFSATKSYLDFVSKTSFNKEAAAIPEYWGMQTRIAYNTKNQKIYANGIFGDNNIVIDSSDIYYQTEGTTLKSGGWVYATGITWEKNISNSVSSVITASAVGNKFDRLEYTINDTFFKNSSIEQEQAIKTQFSVDFLNSNRFIFGLFLKRADFLISIWDKPDTLKYYADSVDTFGNIVFDLVTGIPITWSQKIDQRNIGYKYGGFVSFLIRPTTRLKIVPGLRTEAFTINKSLNFSPRLNLSYSLLPQLELTGAAGIQYQDPDYFDLAASDFNKNLKSKRASTIISGLEYQFASSGIKCIIEGYYKKYDNLPVDSILLRQYVSPLDKFVKTVNKVSVGKGRSYGLEFFAQKKLTKEFSWSVAYSVSKSECLDPRIGHEGEWYRSDFDFVHSITITGGWKKELLDYSWYNLLKKHLWFKILSPVMPVADRNEISAKWRYLGPRPHPSMTYDESYHRWYINSLLPINSDVYGTYHKLDLRWERRFGFGFLQMIYYFDLQNVYNKKNIWTKIYVDGKQTPSSIYQLSFFPAGGIIIGF
jgi:hypothetical protein